MDTTRTDTTRTDTTRARTLGRGGALSAGSIVGTPVVNRDDENIGDIRELMLDVDNGRIRYAVLDFGGVLGVGNKLFAVPFGAFDIDREHERFKLDVDKDVLKEAEGFDKNDWPDFADESFERRMHDYYGVDRYWNA